MTQGPQPIKNFFGDWSWTMQGGFEVQIPLYFPCKLDFDIYRQRSLMLDWEEVTRKVTGAVTAYFQS
jgi:hypothetical protein